MIKWWQKTNRGIILLLAVLLSVSIYLVIDAVNAKKERTKLTDLSSQYITESSLLFTYPEELDFWTKNAILPENLFPALSAQADPIKHYFCDNEAVIEQEIEESYSFFKKYYESEHCPRVCTRTPYKIEIKELYHDSATVYVYSRTSVEYSDLSGKRYSDESDTMDTLFFLKLNGEWKLINSDSAMNEYFGEEPY